MRTRREEKGNNSKFVPLHREYYWIILIFDKRILSVNGEFCLVARKRGEEKGNERNVTARRKLDNERGTGTEKRYRLRVIALLLFVETRIPFAHSTRRRAQRLPSPTTFYSTKIFVPAFSTLACPLIHCSHITNQFIEQQTKLYNCYCSLNSCTYWFHNAHSLHRRLRNWCRAFETIPEIAVTFDHSLKAICKQLFIDSSEELVEMSSTSLGLIIYRFNRWAFLVHVAFSIMRHSGRSHYIYIYIYIVFQDEHTERKKPIWWTTVVPRWEDNFMRVTVIP